MAAQIEFARIGQFAAWHTLEEINHGLEGAQLDLSRGSRQIRLQDGNLIPLQDLVDQIFALRPRNYPAAFEGDTYGPVAIKVGKFINDEASQSCFACLKQGFGRVFGRIDKEATIRDDAFSALVAEVSGSIHAHGANAIDGAIDPRLFVNIEHPL